MATIGRIVLGIIVLVVIAALIVPFLIPIPRLEGVAPPKQLADADSRFSTINGLQVHYKIAGQGEPLILLLHGFSANTYSWRKIMEPLASQGTVVAFDRPASGLTQRPLGEELRTWPGDNPYGPDAQAELVAGLIQALGFQQAILVGNSAGGAIAMHTYLSHPERVEAIVFVDAAIYTGGGAPDWIKPLLRTPQMNRLGPLVSRNLAAQGDRLIRLAWHDPSKIRPEDIAGYRRSTLVEGWDRALWEFTLASRDLKLGERVNDVKVPTLVITGDDDRIVPTEESLRLARELPQAELVVIPACGHVPQEECPEAFVAAMQGFVAKLPGAAR